MNRSMIRGLGVLLLLALATASLAPAAQAGHGHRGHRHGRAVFGGSHVVRVVEHHTSPGAVFAGFLGGLVLGTVLSDAQAAPPPPVYEYYDPYCGERFVSLEVYGDHAWRHRHPLVVDVIDVHSRRCVDTYRWRDGRWCGRYDRDGRYDDDRDWDE